MPPARLWQADRRTLRLFVDGLWVTQEEPHGEVPDDAKCPFLHAVKYSACDLDGPEQAAGNRAGSD